MRPLPISVDVLVGIVSALFGVLHGRSLFRKGVSLNSTHAPRKAILLAFLGVFFVFANTALLVVRSEPALAWGLPLPVEYFCLMATWTVDVSVMAFIFAAIVTVAVHERHRLRWVLLASSIAAVFYGEYAFRTSALAAPPKLHRPRISADGIVMQSCWSTCAAATCANIARFHGVEKSEQDMVDILGTTIDGTTPAQVVYGMRRLGFSCEKKFEKDLDIRKINAPAVLFVGPPFAPDSHAVAFVGFDGDDVKIWDPQSGNIPQAVAKLREIWQGRAIEISR